MPVPEIGGDLRFGIETPVVEDQYDVVVDMRRSSPTLGQYHGEFLSAENHNMLWVPPGFAHGFYVTSEYADFQYKCTDSYELFV